jgi:2-polyprenyl-3-methyl-5-hydroxy-6-metoxy-1,4-benzoquinol methylase
MCDSGSLAICSIWEELRGYSIVIDELNRLKKRNLVVRMGLPSRALEKYEQDGLTATINSTIRFLSNKLGRTPVIHYLSIFEYLSEPNINNIHKIKRANRNFWLDRYYEIHDSTNMTHSQLANYYIRNGLPNSNMYRKIYTKKQEKEYEVWNNDTPTHSNQLLEAYRDFDFYHINRLMLGYHRYDIAERFLTISDKEEDSLEVLDYGCGVADPSVYLGSLGSEVTIVDLDTQLLDFASWRLDERNISHDIYRESQAKEPANIPNKKFDFIIMSEFLEHVPDPKLFLDMAISRLSNNGVLYDSFGREFTHSLEGQHLKEAKEVAESSEYKSYHRDNLNKTNEEHFWRKD